MSDEKESKQHKFLNMLVKTKLELLPLKRLREKTNSRLDCHKGLQNSAAKENSFLEQTVKELAIIDLVMEYIKFMEE